MTPSQRRWWVNWALVISAVASVGAVILTRNEWTSAERAARATHLVVGFRTDEIRGLAIVSGTRRLSLRRGASASGSPESHPVVRDDEHVHRDEPRWVFVAPYQGEAEEAAVDALIRAIEFAPFIRKVDDTNFDRRAAGLDAPLQSVELDMGSVRTRIHIGAPAPTPAKSRYIEVGGEGTANKGVYVVSEATAEELLVSPDEFRVRQLVPYGADSLKHVVLTDSRGRAVAMERSNDGDWRIQLERPPGGVHPVRLEQGAVQRFFAALSRGRAERFLSEPPNRTPLGDGQVEASFTPATADAPPLKWRFGGQCDGDATLSLAVRLSEPPLAVCTTPLHLETFVEQLPELVERRLFGVTTDAVEEIRIHASERTLELARRADAWTMRSPRSGDVERDVGEAFVESLIGIRGELLTKPPDGLALLADVRILQPHLDDQPTREEKVEVFSHDDHKAVSLFAHRLTDDVWLEISSSHRRTFLPSTLLLRSTQLLNADVEDITRVSIHTGTWTQAFEYAGHAEGCKLQAPLGYTADGALCLDIIDELRTLRAKAWISETDDGSFGFEQPTLRAVFSLKASAKTDKAGEFTLLVGKSAPGNSHYAQLLPNPAVFTLQRSAVETISALVVDRSQFMIDPAKVQTLRVKYHSGSTLELAFRRLGDELVPLHEADSPRRGAAEEVTLVDALSLLRPEAAVALLPTGQPMSAPPHYGFDAPLLDVRINAQDEKGPRDFRWVLGKGDVYRNMSVFYAMPVTPGPSAVFALPREAVQRVLDAL